MGREIDLLVNYPKVKRDVKERGLQKNEEDRIIARKFGREFFDGDRRHGYGGYRYNPRFWQPVIPTFQAFYQLNSASSVLDVGCGKGFMLHDFAQIIPGIHIAGIDVSEYAIQNAMDEVKDSVKIADARKLPYPNHSFDLVISINTIHNLERKELIVALKEIQRVSKGHSFITIDAYRTPEEKEAMYAWNLTAKTILHVDEWKELFQEAGYKGDYFWFIP